MSSSDGSDSPPVKRKRGNPNLYKGMPPLNPEGRKKGSLNKYTKLSRELMSNKGPEIVQKVIDMALEGDRHCLKMCMDRIIPTSKAVEITHDHQDLGINIIVESVKAIEKQEEEEFKTIEAEYEEKK
jgi:hypothetical protein|tara:strand:+ start:817 stop:1197 length:381 start_codon:yes stop_codon:yes gene_type:complete